jgi:hypothetical protein
MALPSWLLVPVGGRHSKCSGASPTLESFGCLKSTPQIPCVTPGSICTHDVLGIPYGEVRDIDHGNQTGMQIRYRKKITNCNVLHTILDIYFQKYWPTNSTLPFMGCYMLCGLQIIDPSKNRDVRCFIFKKNKNNILWLCNFCIILEFAMIIASNLAQLTLRVTPHSWWDTMTASSPWGFFSFWTSCMRRMIMEST